MPHTAAAIPVGRHFVRRYVVRLWDDNGDEIEIKALPLPPEDVVMDRDENRRIIRTVTKVKCNSLKVDDNGQVLEPTREMEVPHEGTTRFFDTRTGEWMCNE
jgi:hypothetical protein